MNFVYNIYMHTNHKDAINRERENEIEREEREERSKRGGERYLALPKKSCSLQ